MTVRANVVVALLLAGASVAIAQPESGDAISYRVKKGDTLELVAAELYGERTDAILIMVANKMQHPRPLVPGEKIRIPRNREYVTAPGDRWASLANEFLGDERRAAFLAAVNDVGDGNTAPPTDALTAGTPIEIPLTVVHESAGGETLAMIAAAYFGDSKNADLLKRYNFLDRDTLDKGDRITVPIIHAKIRAQKVASADDDAARRRARQRAADEAALAALPLAREAWSQGRFDKVIELLNQEALDLDYLDVQRAIEVGLLLGKAYVAVNLDASAIEEFQKVLRRKPDHALAAFADSPKVCALWKRAGGKIDE
jgi:LysM repeat protein